MESTTTTLLERQEEVRKANLKKEKAKQKSEEKLLKTLNSMETR
ncbi:hypothetical protein [Paenibacillus polymyxa]|nr:hypothetical protein [Paenibacillus polymyxa]WDZ59109.1 hypothetical protein MF626_08375 [Paenibacillus polymyxa]